MAQRYSVSAAASASGMSRDTWKKIESGRPVQDTNLAAALELLSLDEAGDPIVGGASQDADQFVESLTGERVVGGVSNEDLLREILRSRAESDQIRAAVGDLDSRLIIVETTAKSTRGLVAALSERVAGLEQQSP